MTNRTDDPPTRPPLGARLRRQWVWSRLFDTPEEPVRIGRFTVIDRVGAGGMGEVFSAHDEELDRTVAIKLVNREFGRKAGADARLLREAQNLARVRHRNVVPVHEVGVFESQVYLAMDYVPGQSFRAWLNGLSKLSPRARLKQVLPLLLDAGRGLQAVHEAGVTHGDFKPDNILVGKDGWVQVVDFGLSRADDGEPGETRDAGDDRERPAAPGAPGAVEIARTGALNGTPGYMAPELFRGQTAGPASDQYSYCVTVYEALCGKRPFRTDIEFAALRAAVLAGRPSAPRADARIPALIRRAVRRGMSSTAEERFPDMSELVATLERWPRVVRRRQTLAAGVLAVAVAVVATAFFSAPGPDADRRAGDDFTWVWNDARRARIAARIAAEENAYAIEDWPGAARKVDDFLRRWQQAHDARDEPTRPSCQPALHALDRELQWIEHNPGKARVFDGLTRLTGEPPCVARARRDDVGSDAWRAHLDTLDGIRERERRGELDGDLLDDIDKLVTNVETLEAPRLLVEALLTKGRILVARGAREEAKKPLDRAFDLGLMRGGGMTEPTVEALARSIYAHGTTSLADAQEYVSRKVAEFEHLLDAMADDNRFVKPLFLNNVGTTYLARCEMTEARNWFEKAVAAQEREPPHRGTDELLFAQLNLAMVTPDESKRSERMDQLVRQLAKAFTPRHPRVLDARLTAALYTSDERAASNELGGLCEDYDMYHPGLVRMRIDCRYHQAEMTARQGAGTTAVGLFLQAIELAPVFPDSEDETQTLLAEGRAALHDGYYEWAAETFSKLTGERPDGPPGEWWKWDRLADAQLGLAQAHLALEHPLEAFHVALAAIANAEYAGSCTLRHPTARRLADARSLCEEARSLLVSSGQVREPLPLCE